MTPQTKANIIIHKIHGKKVTDSNTRDILEKALAEMQEDGYKQGLREIKTILAKLNMLPALKVINNIMEMV